MRKRIPYQWLADEVGEARAEAIVAERCSPLKAEQRTRKRAAQTAAEYRAKKSARDRKRYAEDPEYREKVKARDRKSYLKRHPDRIQRPAKRYEGLSVLDAEFDAPERAS